MIPVQDVVPSGRSPLATLALLAISTLAFMTPTAAGLLPPEWTLLFVETTPLNLVVSMWFLWLFGDNVEARLGRLTAIVLYVGCGWLAVQLATLGDTASLAGLGVAGGVTGILGAYFMLLPRSRVLMFMPMPPAFVEVPAMFFLGSWWLLQAVRFVVAPAAAGIRTDGGAGIWALGAAMLVGALVCLVTRRPVCWQNDSALKTSS